MRVSTICRACHHPAVLNVAGLAGGPYADVPLIELPLECRCGAYGHNLIVSH